MNLKRDSSTVMLFCESYEIFKNNYFAEHRWKAAFTINIDKILTPRSIGQHIYKQRWKTRLSVTTDMSVSG